jgi:hypothetical protein
MELKSRALCESDWETLQSWWKAWEWPTITKEMLPLNGCGGLMIYKEDTLIVAGFLYLTNSNVAWMEWVVSNKEYRDEDRKEALEMLISGLEDVALSVGKNIILSIGRNKNLISTHKKLGYLIDDNPSYEISKKLI